MPGVNRLPRRGSRPAAILDALFVGAGILLITAVAPHAGASVMHAAIRSYFKKKRFEREKFLRDLKNLQQRNIVDYREHADGSVEITLAKRGEELKLKNKLESLEIARPKRWDLKWR